MKPIIRQEKIRAFLAILAIALLMAGCGGGGGGGARAPETGEGSVDGYAFVPIGSGNVIGRTAAQQEPSGFIPFVGAAVSITGSSETDITDNSGHYSFSKVTAGVQSVTLSRAGYITTVIGVEVKADESSVVLGASVLPTVSGSIDVTTNPKGADINLDGVDTGLKTPHKFQYIAVGNHIVTLSAAGKAISSPQAVAVASNATAEVSVNLDVAAICGNGQTESGEECDDGNVADGDGCSATCAIEPYCGDGHVGGGESCDDGNTTDGDGCSALCAIEPYCGDGNLDVGEECDDGNTTNGDGCSSLCAIEPYCGDGAVDAGETCDDGNATDGDGCSSTCAIETVCGNGAVEAGEECDDGNTDDGDGCSSTCTEEPVCGNGEIEEGEECDDGNAVSGDGCAASCYEETMFATLGGGELDEKLYSVRQLSNGDYIAAGWTKTGSKGGADAQAAKFDANGTALWIQNYGDARDDAAYAVAATSGGGFLIAGETSSSGSGGADVYIVKLNSTGAAQLEIVKGGAVDDVAYAIKETADGGFVAAGYTQSEGKGVADGYVLKYNASAALDWLKTFGDVNDDRFFAVVQAADGGYAAAGSTQSNSKGGEDVYVVKMNASGILVWQKLFGDTLNDAANAISLTSDGGYIVAGYTQSKGAGAADFWTIKLDSDGNQEWDKTFGGLLNDAANSIQQTADGGYIVAGYTESYGDGAADFWVLKLDADGNQTWSKTFGGLGYDIALSVQQTADLGFIVAGESSSNSAGGSDRWLIKLNANGECTGCVF